jgi:hypothetical protein
MRSLSFFLVAFSSFGCVSQDVDAMKDGLAAASSQACVVAAPSNVSSLVATEHGVVFAVPTAEMNAPSFLLQRTLGKGCNLSADGQKPIAAAALLDADDKGNVYVFPAQSNDPGVVITMLPEFFEAWASTAAKVDTANNISEVVYAGRGIWSFGVTQEGTSLWVTACGPTGIFSITESGLKASLTPPDSLWEQMPSVLTDDQTFWSVGVRTCGVGGTMTPDCGFALVRTTNDGSKDIGTTLIDVGNGFEQTTLARCGDFVCGVLDSAVVVWDAEGKVSHTIKLGDVGALPTERIVMASGNRDGVYLLLRGDVGTRVVFVSTATAG